MKISSFYPKLWRKQKRYNAYLKTKYKQGLKKKLPGSLQIAAVNLGSLIPSKSTSN